VLLSLDRIDSYIKELQAIKDYPRVVKERDEALAKIEEIKDRPAIIVQDLVEKIRTGSPYKFTDQDIQDGVPELMNKIQEIIDKRISSEVDREIMMRKIQDEG
jgi:hypothetical protein